MRRRFRRQKQGILDVVLELNDDTKIDIEMQVRAQKHWTKRNLYYLGRMYTDVLMIGEKYDKLRRCVSISLLDFKLFPDKSEYHSVYRLRDEGIAIGMERGKAEGKAEAILHLLESLNEGERLPESLVERIREERNEDTLKRWLLSAARAESVEQFMEVQEN